MPIVHLYLLKRINFRVELNIVVFALNVSHTFFTNICMKY